MSDDDRKELKRLALVALREAEAKIVAYANACELGHERYRAFELMDNIRYNINETE